jgi:hypothetical protein
LSSPNKKGLVAKKWISLLRAREGCKDCKKEWPRARPGCPEIPREEEKKKEREERGGDE